MKNNSQITDDTLVNNAESTTRGRKSLLIPFISFMLAITTILLGIGALKYRDVSKKLDSSESNFARENEIRRLASDYALKSLTYDYALVDEFISSVQEGVSEELRAKYLSAAPLLKGIMSQAQVVSTGKVISTEALESSTDVHQVLVTVNQKTKNLQQPELRNITAVLKISVREFAGKWQILDIGPTETTEEPKDSPADNSLVPSAVK
ncbi:MAG: hypothetical protein ACRCSF_09895 [Mycobacteriaceae bacterium]